jgi:predicted ATP-binding protein involved in virulence
MLRTVRSRVFAQFYCDYWQKKVVKMLKIAFPNIQFIVTTHSPLILHSLDLGDRIITLEDNQVY